MKTVEYYFKGIDCPNCAAKVEAQLNKISNIEEARVNFISKKIIINYKEEEFDLKELEVVIKKYEPDAVLSKEELEESHKHEHHHEHGCCHDHDHECCHEHEHHHEHNCCKRNHIRNLNNILFILGICFGIGAVLFNLFIKLESILLIGKLLFIISYLLLAYKIIIKSFKNIIKGNIFDENLLMLVASVGALIINEGLEAILVVLLYRIGEYFQDKALGESTDAIASLTKLKVDVVHLENLLIVHGNNHV